MTELAWIATEARTGKVIAEMPDLDVASVSRVVGTHTSTTANLPLPKAPENWRRATLPRATTLVLLADGRPVWGGDVLRRERGDGDEVALSLATFEAYMDCRYVGDHDYSDMGQNLIVADLADQHLTDSTTDPGRPLLIDILDGPGQSRDRIYADAEDKTLLSVLQEMSGVIGGPEWTVVWQYRSNPERYVPVLQVGTRVGRTVTAGLMPSATFDLPGCVTSARYVEDWASGRGATDVMAVSTADGDVRPQSSHHRSADPERPLVEYRWTPTTSITDLTTLDAHAARGASILSLGSLALELTADLDTAPQLGSAWDAGDDIGYVIGGVDQQGREMVPAFPGGFSGTARAIGWTLDLGDVPTISPILTASEWGA